MMLLSPFHLSTLVKVDVEGQEVVSDAKEDMLKIFQLEEHFSGFDDPLEMGRHERCKNLIQMELLFPWWM